jgi:hypothetical protein
MEDEGKRARQQRERERERERERVLEAEHCGEIEMSLAIK